MDRSRFGTARRPTVTSGRGQRHSFTAHRYRQPGGPQGPSQPTSPAVSTSSAVPASPPCVIGNDVKLSRQGKTSVSPVPSSPSVPSIHVSCYYGFSPVWHSHLHFTSCQFFTSSSDSICASRWKRNALALGGGQRLAHATVQRMWRLPNGDYPTAPTHGASGT